MLFHRANAKGKPAREVPKDVDKERIIRALHSDKVGACHFGVAATFNKVSERYFWKKMYEDVLKEVKTCEICQKQNVIQKGPSELHPVTFSERAFSLWGMDLIGPFKESASGNNYIAVFTEYLTRWAEAKPIVDKSAESVTTAIMECIITRFGAPERIITDQGREFVNTLNSMLCEELNIKRRRPNLRRRRKRAECENRKAQTVAFVQTTSKGEHFQGSTQTKGDLRC